jgi:hypothetical protein
MDIPRVNPNAAKGGIAGAAQEGVEGLLSGGGMGAVTGALKSGANSLLGSTMGPSGAGLNQLLGQLTGGEFGSPGASTRMPTHSQLSVTLQPVYSRARTTQFNLDDFAAGTMLRSTKLGGFI